MSIIGAEHLDSYQSNYWIPKYQLFLSLYVDDIVVSGPSRQHAAFWKELQKYLEIKDPSDIDCILGRYHQIQRNDSETICSFDMCEFIDNACQLYEELSGKKLKPAPSPYVAEGSLTDEDWEVKGALSHEASRVLMKTLWCARLARPDLMKGISDLTRRLTVWSKADDKRLHRLMSYLFGSTLIQMSQRICVCVSTLIQTMYQLRNTLGRQVA